MCGVVVGKREREREKGGGGDEREREEGDTVSERIPLLSATSDGVDKWQALSKRETAWPKVTKAPIIAHFLAVAVGGSICC